MQNLETSEKTTELFKAVLDVRKSCGPVIKDQKNPFFKSNYASLNAVLNVLNKPLEENELALMQFPVEGGIINYLMHSSGEWMKSRCKITSDMKKEVNAQAMGSLISYARRYSLVSIFGLAQSDDDGNSASDKKASTTLQGAILEMADQIKDVARKQTAITKIEEADGNLAALNLIESKIKEILNGQE